ncbi:MAG: hypothetical protein IPL49_11160 [Saprospirales bacterium]|nr:hypothetical protein [Saprospirales bacterium]
MTAAEKLYKSILQSLSQIPVAHLQQVNNYLHSFRKSLQAKEDNRSRILALRGAWNDLSETDFNDVLQIAKSSGEQAFGRVVDL